MGAKTLSSWVVCVLLAFFVIGFVIQVSMTHPDMMTWLGITKPKSTTVATSYVQPVGGSASGYT